LSKLTCIQYRAHWQGAFVVRWQQQVYVTPHRDGGVDVVALESRVGVLLQCKTSSKDGAQLGWDAVKDVVAGHALCAKRHPETNFARTCVTNQFFNSTAHERAGHNDVEMVEKPALEKASRQA